MGERLIAHGFGTHYQSGAGPDFTGTDQENYREWQLALGYTGAAADSIPGPASWTRLMSDDAIVPAFPGAEFFRRGVTSAFCPIAENALINAGCSCFRSTGNPWGYGDTRSYRAFQRLIGDQTGDGRTCKNTCKVVRSCRYRHASVRYLLHSTLSVLIFHASQTDDFE